MVIHRNSRKKEYVVYADNEDGTKGEKVGGFASYREAEIAYRRYCIEKELGCKVTIKPGYIGSGELCMKWNIPANTLRAMLINHDKYYLGIRRGYAYSEQGLDEIIAGYLAKREEKIMRGRPLLSMPDIRQVAAEYREKNPWR